MTHISPAYVVFHGDKKLFEGSLVDAALAAKTCDDAIAPVQIFDAATSASVDVDLRDMPEAIRNRLEGYVPPGLPGGHPSLDAAQSAASADTRGPGRPKLGVVAREVTLLPRHWDWLASQPGGASVALRKLVEAARRDPDGRERRRLAQESAYRFMAAMAGDRPHFEEAARALFQCAHEAFGEATATWPEDITSHVEKLAAPVFDGNVMPENRCP